MPEFEELLNRVAQINSGIEISPAQESDASQFTSLINRQYARQKNDAYFHWQFFETPMSARLFVARDGISLAGCYGVQILPLSDGRKCALTVDLITAEHYRNRGLFYLLEPEAVDYAKANGAAVMLSFPNVAGMRAHTAIPGWHSLGKIATMSLTDSPIADELQPASCEDSQLISIAKSPSYRSWRFDRNPTESYKYMQFPSGDFAVTKVFTDPSNSERFGDIVDFECKTQEWSKLAQLFCRSAQSLQEKKVSAVTTWSLKHTALFSILRSLGFHEKEAQRYFCVKAVVPDAEDLTRIDRWFLVQADSELY